METVQEMIEHASVVAEKMFDRLGHLGPMWHAVQEDGDHVVIPNPSLPKDVAIPLVRSVFEELRIVRCLFVDEAWTVEYPKEWSHTKVKKDVDVWFKTHKSIEGHPFQREIVTFQLEDAVEGMWGARRDIIREPGVKARLGPLSKIERMKGAEGRLVGMLPNLGGTKQ